MPQISQLSEVFSSQLFWLALVFGLIFFGIGRGMLPKIRSVVDERDNQVASDVERARAARASAEETEAEWRARMDEARIEASRIAQEAKQASARETEARVRAAIDQIDARIDQSRQRIRDAVAAARVAMEVVAAEAAQEMVEQLTGIRVDKEEAAQAVKTELKVMSTIDR
jgi:F-type H+-transporting ATPase subunit b